MRVNINYCLSNEIFISYNYANLIAPQQYVINEMYWTLCNKFGPYNVVLSHADRDNGECKYDKTLYTCLLHCIRPLLFIYYWVPFCLWNAAIHALTYLWRFVVSLRTATCILVLEVNKLKDLTWGGETSRMLLS